MTYAIVVLVGMPINYIAEKSWIVFNHDGIIGRTSLNWLGPTLYCTFYELWMGFVCVHFIYRYIVVCRPNWKQKIESSWKIKLLVASFYLSHVLYSTLCGMLFCSMTNIFKELEDKIREDFDVQEPQYIGYILLRIRTIDGQLNPGGIISIANHYLIVLVSVGIILYTGTNIWLAIRKMQNESVHLKEINLQRQMFGTLLIQTIVPFFLCHLPTLIYLTGTAPFIDQHFSFGSMSSMFSFLTSVPKVIDPIVVMTCIREYRQAALNILCLKRVPNRVGSLSTTGGTHISLWTTQTDGLHSQTAAEAFRRGELSIHGVS